MRRTIPFLSLVFLFLLSACDTDTRNKCETTATIIGQDFRLCALCGGMFVEIEGDTLRIFSSDPEDLFESVMATESGDIIGLSYTSIPQIGDEIEISCLDLGI